MNLGLNNKTALVTGGCHGIGFAIADCLKEEGCIVQSCCRHTGFDALNLNSIDKLMERKWRPDILINNVGGGGRWGNENPLQTKLGVWDEVYRKNAIVATRFTLAYLPYMLGQKWGRVITIASIYGKESGGRPWFTMAKASEIALMKEMARLYQDSGITFNSVCPGPIWIEGKEQDKYERYGKPEDIANLVVFLCSDKAKWINGASIAVDGGFSRAF